MIAYVFKRSGARTYSGRYRLDGETKLTQVELGCTNRQVADKKLGQIVEEKEREAAGIIAPKVQRDAAQTPLASHLDEMIASKAGKRDGLYLTNLKNQVVRLIAECGWKFAKDVSPDAFQEWLSRQTLSAKSLNSYLTSLRTLLNWMEKRGRILSNPLKSVELLSTTGEAGERSAILYTIIEACRRRGLDPFTYLREVFTRLPSMTNWQVKDITPQAWAKSQACAGQRAVA